GQRALALVPTDENEVQRFLEGLNKAGDRAAAIRFYEKFAKELEELLDLQPAAETRALVDEIRSEDGVPVQRPALNEVVQDRVPTDSRADPEPRRTPPPHEGAPPTGRRLKAWAVGTLGTAAIVAGTFFLGKVLGVSSQPPTTDPTDEIVLAVMPFTDLSSGQGDERLSESITVLLDMELDGTPGITRTVDRNALFPRVGERSRETRLPTAEALALAEHFGATHFILGEVIDTGEDEVNLSATVYSTRGASAMELETLSASGSVRELPFLVSALAEQALRALPVPAGVRLSGIATFTSDSPEALEEYLRGDEEFRATRYAEAFESFDQAVDIDPTFALAHYWKSVASVMILRFDDASLAADRAVEHRGRLKNRERRLVEAWNLLIDGSAIEAKTRFQRILRDYPDDVEAHFGLGTVQVYFNPILGESVAEAEDQFLKVLDLSPNFGQAVFHRLEFETRRRDSVAFDTLLAKVDPESDQALAWDAVRAFWLGDEAARWEVRNRIGLSDPKEAGLAVARVAAFLRDYEAAEELADLLTRPNPEPEIQGAAHLLMAMARFGQGRWTDGMASLDASETFSPAWAIELRALFTGFPFRTPAREEIEAVREALEGWAADQQVSSANFVLFAHNGYHGYLRTYLLALNSVWLGNTSEARDYARELAEMPRSDERRAIARSWADGVRARAFLMEGEDSAAVSLLSTPRANVPLWRISISPFFSRAFDRFALGELLMQLDEYDEAMRW
ncbi:MAG: hypothetical protein HKO65_03400, partial [Gemmatimonadetes bacterium]|nr:hypothetical protein [Gemmatimonadota bacterium]